ncbi:D-hexose-6-phosphate mutarotase [Variovorax dokdonensis]|uniref:Putative glucose-6-phosphate 1-epimerase n=1 Tax=Variovorax dokdonensis TaxID=344883 RepID=A0ABT7NBU9_9BURK|nr:D-hexose-6-phosphate mutarotase [Variovorax dokdonensis]MDM0045422.1 D-hexose-6-phosphate mutarotase [Variovorax dokdonensis]
MTVQTINFHGLPALRLELHSGDSVVVALQGAQVLSWVCEGKERLYLSPRALLDGHSAIRGGIPICFPQFNLRGPLPKHGFARNVVWQSDGDAAGDDVLSLVLHDDAATREWWPHSFSVRLRVRLLPRRLRVELEVANTGGEPWTFAAALHTYLRVDDISDVALEGLQGARRWDAVRDDRHVETAAVLRFTSEFDSVYAAPAQGVRVTQPAGALSVTQSASLSETVVWNPGVDLSARLADMPDDGFRHMLCVEAARIDEPVMLTGGGQWTGWQELSLD